VANLGAMPTSAWACWALEFVSPCPRRRGHGTQDGQMHSLGLPRLPRNCQHTLITKKRNHATQCNFLFLTSCFRCVVLVCNLVRSAFNPWLPSVDAQSPPRV